MAHSAAANNNLDALELLLSLERPTQDLLLVSLPKIQTYSVEPEGYTRLAETNGTVLHTAVTAGHVESVELLLRHYPSPDISNLCGETPSCCAVYEGRADILDKILSHGGSIDARDSFLETLLFKATEAGDLGIMSTLLDRGANPAVLNDTGQTLFHAAASSRVWQTCVLLVNSGIVPSAVDTYRLHWTGFKPCLMLNGIVEGIAEAPCFMSPPQDLPGDRLLLKLIPSQQRILSLTSRLWVNGPTVLYLMAAAGYHELVQILIEAGAMTNQEGGIEGTPLMGACAAGRLDVVKHLVRAGAVTQYQVQGVQVSAFTKAKLYPRIKEWLLTGRFMEQRMILGGHAGTLDERHQATTALGEDDESATNFDGAAMPTKDLVLEPDLELYLESVNWFLPARRFVDRGDGGFDLASIAPADFSKYRPDNYPRKLAACPGLW